MGLHVNLRAERADVEAALLARVAAGDLGAPLEALYDAYEQPLYRLGLRMLHDPGLAEDLVQETFLRFWRSARRFDPERGSVRALVFTIARRVAADAWRRRLAAGVPSAGRNEHIDDEADDEVERILLEIDVQAALDALSAKHREVLELHFREDLSQTQIARRLDLPLGTVKTRIYHALRALRPALRACRRSVDPPRARGDRRRHRLCLPRRPQPGAGMNVEVGEVVRDGLRPEVRGATVARRRSARGPKRAG